MYCIKCGNEINPNSKFCRYCGEEIPLIKTPQTNINERDNQPEANETKRKRVNYYAMAFKKFGVFEGRSSRKEYWMFCLWNIIIMIILGILEGIFGIYSESDDSIFVSIYQLIVLIPNLSLSVRRMHDVNKSGWFIFIPIYNLILFLRQGDSSNNDYGSIPRY